MLLLEMSESERRLAEDALAQKRSLYRSELLTREWEAKNNPPEKPKDSMRKPASLWENRSGDPMSAQRPARSSEALLCETKLRLLARSSVCEKPCG